VLAQNRITFNHAGIVFATLAEICFATLHESHDVRIFNTVVLFGKSEMEKTLKNKCLSPSFK
jgi:hypothetical protein